MPSPIPAYAIGFGAIGLGLHCIWRPEAEYPRFGLPLAAGAVASPLVHVKGIRETTFGLLFLALQYTGQETALTVTAAVTSLAGLGDGFVVWIYGGEELRYKAFGHWCSFVVLAGWAAWRARGRLTAARK